MMVDDDTNAMNQLERIHKMEDAKDKAIEKSMKDLITDFMELGLAGKFDEQMRHTDMAWCEAAEEALQTSNTYPIELIAKVASGAAGMLEAKETLAHLARQYAYLNTEDAGNNERTSPYYIDFAMSVKRPK